MIKRLDDPVPIYELIFCMAFAEFLFVFLPIEFLDPGRLSV